MSTTTRTIAAAELVLVFPAALFMTALFVRDIQPPQYEPAHTAKVLVDWFSARPFLGLDVFLVSLPLAALVLGCVTVLRRWHSDAELRRGVRDTFAVVRAQLATLLIACATLMAGGILAIVALHVATD